MHQKGTAMGAMPWLIAVELDLAVGTLATCSGHGHLDIAWADTSVWEGTLMHQALGQLGGAC